MNLIQKYGLAEVESTNSNASGVYVGIKGLHDIKLECFNSSGHHWYHLTIAFGGAHHLLWENRTPMGLKGTAEVAIWEDDKSNQVLVIAPMCRTLVQTVEMPRTPDPIAFCLGLEELAASGKRDSVLTDDLSAEELFAPGF